MPPNLSIDGQLNQPKESAVYEQISDLICRFQRSFDLHDWEVMRSCLDDEIFVDYSSFRGTEPSRISADEYVELRRQALSDLLMQHNHCNLVLSLQTSRRASASCNYQIMRFEREGNRHFHSWGTYDFGFVRRSDEWRISSIAQHLLKNDGEPSIHTGATTIANQVTPA